MRGKRDFRESVDIEDRLFFPSVDIEEMTSFDLEYTLIVEFLVRYIVDKEEKIR
jgi:hypothetical protein